MREDFEGLQDIQASRQHDYINLELYTEVLALNYIVVHGLVSDSTMIF